MINSGKEYSVASPGLEAPYQQLLSLFSALFDATLQGSGKNVLEKALDELVVCSNAHFRDEEALMVKIGYPQLVFHRRLHVERTGQMLGLQRDLQAGRCSITVELLHGMKKWLVHHILTADKKLAQFAAEHAKTEPPVAVVVAEV